MGWATYYRYRNRHKNGQKWWNPHTCFYTASMYLRRPKRCQTISGQGISFIRRKLPLTGIEQLVGTQIALVCRLAKSVFMLGVYFYNISNYLACVYMYVLDKMLFFSWYLLKHCSKSGLQNFVISKYNIESSPMTARQIHSQISYIKKQWTEISFND